MVPPHLVFRLFLYFVVIICSEFPYSGANFTLADRSDQPRKSHDGLTWQIFPPIWFKFVTVGNPLNRNRMFVVAATICRPISPTDLDRPIVKTFDYNFDEIW